MRDEQLNRLHIELAIARARQERAQALANLLRQTTTTLRNAGKKMLPFARMCCPHSWKYICMELNHYGMGLEYHEVFKCRICKATGSQVKQAPSLRGKVQKEWFTVDHSGE